MRRFITALIVLGAVACSSSPTAPSSLVVEDIVVGTGATAVTGDTLTVHYVGRLQNGSQFESSYDLNSPYTFRVGAGQVIAGWDQGIPGMKVGGKRRLTIPPSLAYGDQQVGSIPPNSTLVFDVELLSIAGK